MSFVTNGNGELIQIDPVTANGAFINLAMVNHTDTEFTLDLAYVQPQAPGAVICV